MADEIPESDIFRIRRGTEDNTDTIFRIKRGDPNDSDIFRLKKDECDDFVGTYYWSGVSATTNWNESPGSYACCSNKRDFSGFSKVRIKPISGWWADIHQPDPAAYRGTLGFKTQTQFKALGPGGTMESSEKKYVTSAEAQEAWLKAAPIVMNIGEDGILGWGFEDKWPSNNEGGLKFEFYGLRK